MNSFGSEIREYVTFWKNVKDIFENKIGQFKTNFWFFFPPKFFPKIDGQFECAFLNIPRTT